MSAPVQPESVTLDDLEHQSAPTPPDLTQIKVDGEGIPDDLKGKSVNDLIKYAASMADALKTSERARAQADQMATLAARTAPPPPEPPKEEPMLTREQLAELYEKDPLQAIEVMQKQASHELMKNIDARAGSLTASVAAQAEAEARRKYSAEFEVLGPESSEMIRQIPNAKQVLTSAEAFDNLIAIVRGKEGSFQKMAQHYATKAGAPTLETARAAQAADAGISMNSQVRAPAPQSTAQLDATSLEIARNLGLTPEEYVKWSKV